jgi:hypothetical protein
MGIISTITSMIGGKVIDHFTGNIGNKIIDTVNDYLKPEDSLPKDVSADEFTSTFYNKLTQEERIQVIIRFKELENEAEKINVELQETMATSDKVNGGYRKWVSIVMAITIAITTTCYTFLIGHYVITTGDWPNVEIIFGAYAIPAIVLLLSFGMSGRVLKEIVTALKPEPRSKAENAVDKILHGMEKKKK